MVQYPIFDRRHAAGQLLVLHIKTNSLLKWSSRAVYSLGDFLNPHFFNPFSISSIFYAFDDIIIFLLYYCY